MSAPAGTGTVDVTVNTQAGTSQLTPADQFTYAEGPAPTVSKVKPHFGAGAGGTSVTITGTKFTGVTAVEFGSTAAKSFTVNSETSITAVSPGGMNTVDVTVTAAGGTSTTGFAEHFEYGPDVSAVSPRTGPNEGGIAVEVIGTNFNEVQAVQFGSSYASFTRNSETSITAVVPPFTGARRACS